mmetsp:Transcript_2614/g.7176  ORF Transcript_2614/g.7176 Transcript_2614/m.7176 type:complete len:388 (+) Transcript_2614:326-1489(+)
MSIAVAMSSFFGRNPHRLVSNTDEEPPPIPQAGSFDSAEREQSAASRSTAASTATATADANSSSGDDDDDIIVETLPADEDVDVENQNNARSTASGAATDSEANTEANATATATANATTTTTTTTDNASRVARMRTELQEEREHIRRRTSACVLFAVFILFRLWVQALATGDFGLLMVCMFGTHFTARFIRTTREREEELENMIRELNENADNADINRGDLRVMSFQAQLALAIMESQRQMMEGGYGHPDGHNGSNGVSDEAKERWDRFEFDSARQQEQQQQQLVGKQKATYGSSSGSGIAPEETDALKFSKDDHEEEPHCSICLGEYEDGEKLVSLPCGHVYHDDCITSWTENHTRCPLCNLDLESVTEAEEGSAAATTNNADEEA